ncbi:YjiH family protein [Tenuibacillus multivorans]|uniref:Nucleoside recognition GATE domain-containing membrane protein YjiH n=1 Tax=Tenuibacillus multivorans TaxID=237069 RepID=A0A1G9WU37_9BACI|nr:YjiH family protein [Tenuibacillus multivorans]GEL78420.1 histidine transporter [Tenuibacillus multivorans]SDM88114.1 nucleoside recognition GATE domain-containing membrane protein YjiH [Tenuibacillus multivorans]
MSNEPLRKVQHNYESDLTPSFNTIIKLIIFSFIGLFVFFVPVTIGDNSTIMLDHIVTWFEETFPSIVPYYALIVILAGAIYPFYKKEWNKDLVTIVFSCLKVLGLIVAIMLITEVGPAFLFDPDIGPFLFNSLVIPVGLLVPIGAVFLAFIVGYGLLEFIGTIMRPIMRPIFKTPGRSAIDAFASFAGSYSIALLITNRVYKEGKYSLKESMIIATGFSTVSATFMIVVASTLGFMDIWNTFFWTTLIITFIVTAITVRIWPLNRVDEKYYTGEPVEEPKVEGNIIKEAWTNGLRAASQAPSLSKNIWINLKDGFIMVMSILPSILSVGLIGLLLAEFTPFFDILGYIFYPFTALLQIPDAMLAAKGAAMGIAEMFLPALLVAEAGFVTKFVIGVTSISSILFFSASIPVILSTQIPVKISDLVIIYVERVILTLIIATPIAFLLA